MVVIPVRLQSYSFYAFRSLLVIVSKCSRYSGRKFSVVIVVQRREILHWLVTFLPASQLRFRQMLTLVSSLQAAQVQLSLDIPHCLMSQEMTPWGPVG